MAEKGYKPGDILEHKNKKRIVLTKSGTHGTLKPMKYRGGYKKKEKVWFAVFYYARFVFRNMDVFERVAKNKAKQGHEIGLYLVYEGQNTLIADGKNYLTSKIPGQVVMEIGGLENIFAIHSHPDDTTFSVSGAKTPGDTKFLNYAPLFIVYITSLDRYALVMSPPVSKRTLYEPAIEDIDDLLTDEMGGPFMTLMELDEFMGVGEEIGHFGMVKKFRARLRKKGVTYTQLYNRMSIKYLRWLGYQYSEVSSSRLLGRRIKEMAKKAGWFDSDMLDMYIPNRMKMDGGTVVHVDDTVNSFDNFIRRIYQRTRHAT